MTPRPYRLWDTKAKADIPRRKYASPFNAHRAALIIATTLRPGHTIELLGERSRMIAQYTGSIGGIKFHGPLILNLRALRESERAHKP
jgi:hypothetical protein